MHYPFEVPLPRHYSQVFSQSLIIGAAAKEILRSLLEATQYKVYPFGYESSLSSLKMHIWDSHIQESNAVERVRSMPGYVVSAEKGLKLVEIKFRKRSERDGHPGWAADPLSSPRSFADEKEAQKETRS